MRAGHAIVRRPDGTPGPRDRLTVWKLDRLLRSPDTRSLIEDMLDDQYHAEERAASGVSNEEPLRVDGTEIPDRLPAPFETIVRIVKCPEARDKLENMLEEARRAEEGFEPLRLRSRQRRS